VVEAIEPSRDPVSRLMNMARSAVNVVLFASLVMQLLCSTPSLAGQSRVATKFDSYGHLRDDDETAPLDAFCSALEQQPASRGFIIGYSQASIPPGVLLRRIYGDQRYLINRGNFERNRVVVVEGGYRPSFTIELWLVPKDAPSPTPSPTSSPIRTNRPYLFDENCWDCGAAVNLDLLWLSEGLRFYAEALKGNPSSRGVIVVRRRQRPGSKTDLSHARQAKRLLVHDYKIDANRLAITTARHKKHMFATVEVWIVPQHAKSLRRR
jgi:hypothetical protein